jgi:hypothetical protein
MDGAAQHLPSYFIKISGGLAITIPARIVTCGIKPASDDLSSENLGHTRIVLVSFPACAEQVCGKHQQVCKQTAKK